ncbi:MAG: radical SAM protein [Methanomethylophilus sp.]
MDDQALADYMSEATDRLIGRVRQLARRNPAETRFLLRFAIAEKKAARTRKEQENAGCHVPGFLIASITTSCNLHCRGCYARADGICGRSDRRELTDSEWQSIFRQASDLGISFCILAGGEPLMRRDLLRQAALHRGTVFPVFTNGTLMDSEALELFDVYRNLIPIFSLEGLQKTTDLRRGAGTFDRVTAAMQEAARRHLFFGVSVTVTAANLKEVTGVAFQDRLEEAGCGIVFFIEYVPTGNDVGLALGRSKRAELAEGVQNCRNRYRQTVFMSFPADEARFGGCIGAGRGFFHINPYGDAEACPASPYSDMNLRDHRLTEVLRSPLFGRLRTAGLLHGEPVGGCILREREDEVRSLVHIETD